MKQIKANAVATLLLTATFAIGPESLSLSPVAATELAQAGPAYDPMARPVNPLSPGARSDEPEVELNPELGNLPDTPGAEETFYLCSACHSLAIVKQQRLTDARWDYLWNWMIDAQGMPEQDPETKRKILTYLKRHFSSQR